MEKSKVYFTETINSESLVRMYEALGRELKGRVAVKISTGESDKSNNLRPELIEALVKKLNGTIVECGTAYGGNREDVQLHWKEIEKRGYKDIADVDIMDEKGRRVLFKKVDRAIDRNLRELLRLSEKELLKRRYRNLRNMGKTNGGN